MNAKNKLLSTINKLLPHFIDMHGELAISIDDDIIYHENFTYTDAPWKVGKGSQYLIGSITKQFTAAALLKSLYDRQKVLNAHDDIETIKMVVKNDLQKPISQFLPQEHPTWQGHMPGWATAVTTHQLLTHTSGVKKKNETDFEDRLESTPGEQFFYSNPNYVLLGKIIEAITNISLDAYYKSVLFDPACMENTYLPLACTPKDLKHQANFKKLALGFEYNLIPLEVVFTPAEEKISFDQLSVAGGIVSTIEDCIKWNNALYQGKIISKFLVDLMVDRYIPSIPFPIYYDLDQVWYGYGLDIYQVDRKICYQHPGGLPGYQSRLIYMPASEITIVHLSNSQKDNAEYNGNVNSIMNELGCDRAIAETVFDERFPYYKPRLEKRINIFRFANQLRELFFNARMGLDV